MKFILECDGVETGEYCMTTPQEVLIKTDIGEIRAERALINCLTSYAADKTYQDGANHGKRFGRDEAQEVYRRLILVGLNTLEDIFGIEFLSIVIKKYTVDEIEQKLNEYDMRQIKRGDGIISKGDNVHGVVLDINYNAGDGPNHATQYLIWFENGVAGWCFSNTFLPDGKHYPMAERLYEDLVNGK